MSSGHPILHQGAQVVEEGRILSWSRDDTLRLWDGQIGQALIKELPFPTPFQPAGGRPHKVLLLSKGVDVRLARRSTHMATISLTPAASSPLAQSSNLISAHTATERSRGKSIQRILPVASRASQFQPGSPMALMFPILWVRRRQLGKRRGRRR